MTNLLAAVHAAVRDDRTATAIVADRSTAVADDAVTYSRLWTLTDKFSRGLRDRDVTEDDTVGIRVTDPVAFLVAVYGTLRNGSVPVTIPASFDDRELEGVLEETDATVLVVDDRDPTITCTRLTTLRVAVTVDVDAMLGIDLESFLDNDGISRSGRTGIAVTPRRDDDRALIAYVGRHGGEPLGVVCTHDCLAARARAGTGLPDGRGVDEHLGALPLTRPVEFAYGATATFLEGGTYRPAQGESLTRCERLEGSDVARTFVTPEQYGELRRAEGDTPADAVSVVSRPTLSDERLPSTATVLWETPETGITHVQRPEETDTGQFGTPVRSVETTTLEDDGEPVLAVSGRTMMDAYHGRSSLSERACRELEGERWIGVRRLPDMDSVQAGSTS